MISLRVFDEKAGFRDCETCVSGDTAAGVRKPS